MRFDPNINLNSYQPDLSSIKDTKKLEAAQDFEAMFLQISLKYMRPKLEKDSMFNAGEAEELFYQFQDEALAKEISKSPNNFGIANFLLDN